MTAASGLSADGSIGFHMWLLQTDIMNTAVAQITGRFLDLIILFINE